MIICDADNELFFFFSRRRRHTMCSRDWSSDVCSSDLIKRDGTLQEGRQQDEVGAHAVAVNGNSIGVAMVGGGTPDRKSVV